MRSGSGTLPDVSPRQPNPAGEDDVDELRRLGTQRIETDAALKAAVLRALANGGSVRTVAAAAQLSTNTVQKWKARG